MVQLRNTKNGWRFDKNSVHFLFLSFFTSIKYMATKYVKNAFKNVSLLCNILQQHFIVMLRGNSIIYSYSQQNIISPPHTGTNVNI